MSIDLDLNDRDVLAAMELRRRDLVGVQLVDRMCMTGW